MGSHRGLLRWLVKRSFMIFTGFMTILIVYNLISMDLDTIIDSIFEFDYDDEGAIGTASTGPAKLLAPKTETIQMAVVACKGPKKDSVSEALNMLKSAILFTQAQLHIHIFTDVDIEFKEAIHDWPAEARSRFEYTLHGINYPLDPEEISQFKDWWGPCASFRLFLPEVLKDEDSIIYVDSDVLFLGGVENLWNEFKNFNEDQVGALAPRAGWNFHVPAANQNFIMTPQGKLTQVNSGVFLMNLTRMRQTVFRTADSVSLDNYSWNKDLFFPLYHKFKADMYGDQNLINVVFHYNPHLIYYFSCRYNYHHKFCFDKEPDRWCKSAEEHGAYIVHGSAKTFYNNYSPAFRAINTAFQNYHFEKDIKANLVIPMERNLRMPDIEDHEHCGGKTNLFLKTVKETVESIPLFEARK